MSKLTARRVLIWLGLNSTPVDWFLSDAFIRDCMCGQELFHLGRVKG
jgi:hypothetical protein